MLTELSRNTAVDAVTGLVGEMSLHTADPGATGTDETTADRVAVSFNPASGGSAGLSAPADFTGGASGGPVTWAGLWTAGGVFLGAAELTGDMAFNAAGEYTVTGFTITIT